MNHVSSRRASSVKRFRFTRRFRRTSLSVALLGAFSGGAQALPQDGVVAAGTAAINQSGSTMTITQDSARAILDWQSFGIASGELVQFLQPSSSAVVLNRVLGNNASEIYGQLSANGQVFLTNPNGILFGAGAQVDVGGLVASTLGISNEDFLAGNYQFSGADGGVISNAGMINAQSLVALLAPEVRNDGLIVAQAVGIGAGTGITLDLASGLKLEVTESALSAVIGNRTAIRADGGTIILTATAQQALLGGMINNTGVLAASSLVDEGGRIMLMAGSVATTGVVDVSSTAATGGDIGITGASVALGGNLRANGTDGGNIAVNSVGQLSLADHVSATGTDGAGGEVSYVAGGRLIENNGSVTDVSGSTDGGSVSVQADRVFSSGTYLASGGNGIGGRVDISAQQDVNLLSAQIDASGYTQGGLVRIGGAFQGGAIPDADTPSPDLFLTRWADLSEIGSAQSVLVNDSSQIDVSSSQGAGGTVVIWSEQQTTWLGGIDATGAAGGGAVEISSANDLRQTELLNVDIGAGGQLLLDPKNIVIGSASSASSWVYAGILGTGYVGINDYFGSSVSLNAMGDRLAVGATGDDGSADSATGAGAVYLFTFADTDFGGAALQAVVGSGYTGGSNIDVGLEAWDSFGSSVSLNAAGDRLAVGAYGDDGDGNTATDSGAAYLFAFSDTSFGGGTLQAIIGNGYAGTSDVSLALNDGENFGQSVSLNAAGDRLAVGAPGDSGLAMFPVGTGAAYLFSFSDTSFGTGSLVATLGKGYVGTSDIDMSSLEANDNFGYSVALNAVGDRLAVGAYGDDGDANGLAGSGAVYLFGFADTDFGNGVLLGTLGSGYSAGNDIDLAMLDASDGFGSAVSLNAAGDRLAVGAPDDDGDANAATNSGAVYLFDFADTDFTGGSLVTTLGDGYAGPADINIPLDEWDHFGSGVSLNAAGSRLAIGAQWDAGVGNTVGTGGATYLFRAQSALDAGMSYAAWPGMDVLISASSLAALLDTGTAVTLQASNDITVNDVIIANNASGDGGNLALQAGRSLLLNAGITTDNGDLTLIANDLLANGVINADRDAGAAVITATSQAIDAGTGTVTIDLRSGAGKTNSTSGDINLGAITADTILVTNNGATAGSDVIVDGVLTATGIGNALTLVGDNVTNNAGSLTANNGRWLVYVTDTLASDPFASFAYDFKQYNATYGVSTVLGSGNGFLLSQAPTVTASLTGTVSKEYDATTAAALAAGNYALSGAVQGDTVAINNPVSGTYDNKNVGTGKTVSVTGVAITGADNDGRTVYGYQLASSSINGAVGTVTAKAIDATAITASDKTYDATVAALLNVGSAGLSGAILGDTVSLDVGTAAGAFDTKNVGLAKTVTVSGLALAGTDAGNYTLNGGYTTTADINALVLDVTGITAADKVYNATTAATLDTTAANISGVLGSEAVTLDATAAAGAFDTKDVGLAKIVTVSALALTGADAGNYTLGTYTTSADITALAIDVSGITAGDKVYDATTAATLDTTVAALSGAILGDTVSVDVTSATGAFDTKNVGLTKTVTVSNLALAGTDAGNYTLNAYTTTADITALAIDASGITAVDRVYDATTVATLDTTAAGLAGAILGDLVSLDATAATGAFADKNVGLAKTVTVSGLTLTGTDAGNYTLNGGYTTTADISALAINATGITAADKMYDGLPTATLDTTAAALAGVLGGDTVSLDVTGATGAFSDDIAGLNKTVSVSGLLLAGLDATNYLLNPYTTTADIGLVFSLEQSGVEIHRLTNEEAESWRQRAITLGDVPALAIDRCGIRTGLSGAGRPPCDRD